MSCFRLLSFSVLFSLLLAACAAPEGKVDKWSISGAEVAEFSGEVVDVLCELSGNCAEQCGAGNRQLGIKSDAGTVLISKNNNLYTGASEELWPFCSQQLVVNGQFTQTGDIRIFQVQNIREPGGEWMAASRFLEVWADKNDQSVSDAKQWYRQDTRVTTVLEQNGLLGLGKEADSAYFK